jgi:hypothetical protein
VETILLEDVLATVTTGTAIIKIDIEAMECRVSGFIRFLKNNSRLSYNSSIV